MKKFVHYLIISFLLLASFELASAATVVTVNLQKGDGNPITSGGVLKYHDSNGWQTAINNNNGTFTANVVGTNVVYKMDYNNASQTKTLTTATNPVTFSTVTTTLALEDSDGNPISGGNVSFHNTSWSSSYSSNAVVELLPVSYTVRMDYNNASQTKYSQSVSGASDKILFQTVTTTLALEDSDGNPISGGSVSFHNTGWSTSYSSNAVVELLPVSYTVRMDYNNASQTRYSQSVSGASDKFLFQTVTTTLALEDSDGNPISGGSVKFHNTNWSTSYSSNDVVELLPVSYTVRMDYNNASQTKYSQSVSGESDKILFQTVTTTLALRDCNDNLISGGSVKFHNTSWSTSYSSNAVVELLPVSYTVRMDYNNASQTKYNQSVSGASGEFLYTTTQINFVYNGVIKYHNTNWGTYTQGMQFLPVSYTFKFGDQTFYNFAVSGCSMDGNVNIFNTKKANGSALPNIVIKRNDYGNHYVTVGTTDANGVLFTTNQPNGIWKYSASKDYSTQYILSGPSTLNFQTCNYKASVKHTDGSPFEGIATEYNDYGNHWIDLSPQYTDANGNASIELFAGDYKFRANKNNSNQEKRLELLTPGSNGTLIFQTATFTANVKKHDGSPFEGIATEYNDYGNHWIDLSPKYTDANGNASIELFPGDFTFRAVKNYSSQSNDLEITTSGSTDIVNFQTALAVAFAKDCELNTGVAGISFEYNDYGNHWIDLSPSVTTNDGLASIELFPGSFTLRGKNIYTYQSQSITLTGPSTQVEFNPTRVNLNYPGSVKYNDYGNHWLTINANTYMFPGTYNFRFYNGNTVAAQMPIEIAGCSMDQSLIFVQLQNSQNSGLAGGDFKYRIGWGGYTGLGTDATGNGIWTFVNGNPTNTKVTVSYAGASVEKEQNVQINPLFIFNTVDVTADLRNSVGNLLSASNWEYRYGWGGYSAFTNSGQELLPVSTKIRVSYKGASVEKEQNVGSNSHFDFTTKNVTAELMDSQNGSLTASDWKYRYGWGSYSSMNNLGEELLPVSVKVTVSYKGASVEKEQNVNTNSQYTFQTKNVTAELKDSYGNLLTASDWKYRYGWGSYSSMNNLGEELLPVAVKVKTFYKGACVEKEQNVNTAPNYNFNTVLVTAELKDGSNNILNANSWQYRYGWGSYSSMNNLGEELLPVAVKVKATYNSQSKEKEQNVGSNSNYLFTWNGSAINKLANEYDFTSEKVNVYPNPSDGKFVIENVANYYRLTIYDMTGRLVYQSDINEVNNHNIILNNPVSGAYIIQLEGVGSTVTTPVMIK